MSSADEAAGLLTEGQLRGPDPILREDEIVLQMVRLEGLYPKERQRYLCLVKSPCGPGADSYALLGVDQATRDETSSSSDQPVRPTLGFVAVISWDSEVVLDGDGGFSLFQR